MLINCIVIDRAFPVLFQLHEWIVNFPSVNIVDMFDNRNSAEEFLKSNQIDLIITHSDQDDLSWIKKMRARVRNLFVIITVDNEGTVSWKKEQPNLSYFRKPLEFDNFEVAINKAIDYYRNRKETR